jgi:hypothetical protein
VVDAVEGADLLAEVAVEPAGLLEEGDRGDAGPAGDRRGEGGLAVPGQGGTDRRHGGGGEVSRSSACTS